MFQALESFIVAEINYDNIDMIDKYFAIGFASFWVFFHVYIMVGAQKRWFCLPWDEVIKGDDSAGSMVFSEKLIEKVD